MTHQALLGLVLLGAALVPRGAAAQEPQTPDPAETARFKIGPLYFDSSFMVKNIGTDTNVFAESSDPKEDFTGSIGAAMRGGVRMGRARITFTNNTDYVYYHKYRSEGGSNRSGMLRLEAALARFRPYISWDSLNTNERPRREIDTRARRSAPAYTVGSEIALGLRTRLAVQASRAETAFEPGQEFLGKDLAEELNQQTDSASVTFKYSLTPLTTLNLHSSVSATRFDIAAFRDADAINVTAGFEFNPTALLSGTVSFGLKDFTPLEQGVPAHRGPQASIGVTYSGLGSTRFSGTLVRNLEFSIEREYPYYVVTGGSLTMSQRIAGPVDLVLTVGREQLDYQGLTTRELADLIELLDTATVGLGYRFARGMRWGFNVEFYERRSNLRDDREHRGTRMYASVTYGQ